MKDEASGLMVLKESGETSKPFMPSFKPAEASPSESDAEHDERMEDMKDVSFAKGFVLGVGYGGVDMVTGAGKIIWGGAKFVGRGFVSVGLQFKWVGQWMTGGDTTRTEQMLTEIGDKQMEVVQQSYEMAKFLQPLITAPADILPKMAWAFYSGGYEELKDTALYGSESHRLLFQMACEAIQETKKEWDSGTEGQRGYITGRIVFEVLSLVIPAGAAGKVLSKIEVLQHLRQTKLFKAAARSVLSAKEAALTITKMCFVAGTKVKTQGEEHIHIQDVQAEQKVWSRDELTGEECLKRVLQTFTTHPTELYRLTYEVRGPPGSSASVPLAGATASQRLALQTETLGVTAPHPFWVCNNEPPGFIAAEDLRVGDVLFVGEGKEAVVTHKVLERAPPGETFTTYNFEVEDFHTYFVGKAGVWVHNASARWICESAKDTYLNLKEAFNGNHWHAFLETIRSQRKGMAGQFMNHHQTKIYNEVLDDFLADGGDLKKAAEIPNSKPHERAIDKAFRDQRGEKVYGNPREGEPGYGRQPDRLVGSAEVRVEYKMVSSLRAVQENIIDALGKENTQQIVFYTQQWTGVTDDVIRQGIEKARNAGAAVAQVQKWWIFDGVILRELIL